MENIIAVPSIFSLHPGYKEYCSYSVSFQECVYPRYDGSKNPRIKTAMPKD
jgi:hypothetical protein